LPVETLKSEDVTIYGDPTSINDEFAYLLTVELTDRLVPLNGLVTEAEITVPTSPVPFIVTAPPLGATSFDLHCTIEE
jgi:hypothetical protein